MFHMLLIIEKNRYIRSYPYIREDDFVVDLLLLLPESVDGAENDGTDVGHDATVQPVDLGRVVVQSGG